MTNDWQTLSVNFDPSGWTYAGNNQSDQGDWAERYTFLDVEAATSAVDATLHLVLIGDSPDQQPTGFLDIRNITIRTDEAAIALPGNATTAQLVAGDEDTAITGTVAAPTAPLGATYQLVSGSAVGGGVTIDAQTGVFTFLPTANFYTELAYRTSASFRYQINTGGTLAPAQTVSVTINPINDAPTTASVDEDVEIAANADFSHILFEGKDVDIDTVLRFELVAGSVQNGSVALDSRWGLYTFTPTAGFSGEASFQYTVTDGLQNSVAKTVTLTVLPDGAAPTRLSFDQISDLIVAGQLDLAFHHMLLLATSDRSLSDIAAYHVGLQLKYGNYFTQNTGLAAIFLSQAEGLLVEANIELADLYSQGDGVPRDYTVARTLLEAYPNAAEARYRLAVLKDLGFGEPGGIPNQEAAVADFLFAAERGHGLAAFSLGRRYLQGEGVAGDAADAYFWLGIAKRYGAAALQPLIGFVIDQEQDLAAAMLAPSEVAQLDAAIAAWAVGTLAIVNDAPIGPTLPVTAIGYMNAILTGALLGASDPDGAELAFELVAGSVANGTVVIDGATGVYSFTPTPGYTGPASFQYTVTDGFLDSAPQVVSLTVLSSDVRTAAASYTLPPNLQDLYYNGTGNFIGVGNALNNLVVGAAGADVLNGLGGNDTLLGFGGNDILIAGAGINTLQGGRGDDLYLIDNRSDTITEFAGEGTDQVRTTGANYTLGSHIETLSYLGTGDFIGVGNELANILIGGSGADNLNGVDGNDTLLGFGGDDILIAGAGFNTLQGGGGNDLYLIDGRGDTITEFASEGTDQVRTTGLNYTLGSNIETLSYLGTGDFIGTGNALDNLVAGSGGSDILNGLDGNDTLLGFGGNDILIAGAGVNTLQGGLGDDIYFIDSRSDTITEFAGEGTDQVRTTGLNYTLGSNIETLSYSGSGAFVGTGNGLDNVLVGGGGADVLAGLDGADSLFGAGGVDILTGGAGADAFIFRSQLELGDTILDFNRGAGDILNISALLTEIGASSGNPITANLVSFIANGSGSTILFDADGTGSGSAVTLANLTGVAHGTITADWFLV